VRASVRTAVGWGGGLWVNVVKSAISFQTFQKSSNGLLCVSLILISHLPFCK